MCLQVAWPALFEDNSTRDTLPSPLTLSADPAVRLTESNFKLDIRRRPPYDVITYKPFATPDFVRFKRILPAEVPIAVSN